MKFLIVCTVFVMSALAEPPVENRYLPPQQGYRTTSQDSFAPPSQTYGPPAFGPQKQTDAVIRPRPSSNYLPPRQAQRQAARRPSNQYGAPNAPSTQYGAPNAPSTQYGAPNAPSTQYGAPNAPSTQYGAPNAPSTQYGTPNAPSQEYGAPARQNFGGQQSYNAPQQFTPLAPSQQYGAPERSYLPPNSRAGYAGDEDGNGEPANYSFEYMVKDDESGNDFGHKESRMGDRAEGTYYVLLPDGRKQTVQYEADQNGYRPRISYEDTGAGAGYDRNSQSLDYQQNGY